MLWALNDLISFYKFLQLIPHFSFVLNIKYINTKYIWINITILLISAHNTWNYKTKLKIL